jgi:hypothetical protein
MDKSNRYAESTLSEELISPNGFPTGLSADLCAFIGTFHLCSGGINGTLAVL